MAPPHPSRPGSSPGEAFPRTDRLRRRHEFREVQSRGRRVHTPHFIFIVLPRDGLRKRLGVTVTKKVGSAVERNRVKRLVREVFRRNRSLFPEGCDVACVAKKGAPRLGYAAVLDEVLGASGAMHATRRRARRTEAG